MQENLYNYGSTDAPGVPTLNQEDLEWKNAETQIEDEIVSPEQTMRLGFIRKVFGILSMELFVTALMVYITCTSKAFAEFQKAHLELGILAFITGLFSVIIITCCKGISMKVPHNYIILFVFTISEAYLVSLACIPYSPKTVLLAAAMTAALTFSLYIYALTTKKDFTTLGGMLFVCLISLVIVGICTIFFINRLIEIIYCCCGILLFGFYLVYDIQLLTGEKERKIDLDDYIYGSVSIYLDIINIFLYILRLFGRSSNS